MRVLEAGQVVDSVIWPLPILYVKSGSLGRKVCLQWRMRFFKLCTTVFTSGSHDNYVLSFEYEDTGINVPSL